MNEKNIRTGDILFREGDTADFAYIVVSGSIALSCNSNDGEVKLGTIESSGIFGELALFDRMELRNNTAVAVSDSVVKTVNAEEFDAAFAACAECMKPFINAAFAKFIPLKTRVQTQINAVVKSDISKIVLYAGSENLYSFVNTLVLNPETLPFRIGGYPEGGEKNRKDNVHLALPSHNNPLVISRQHCEITAENDTIVINDLGSRFGTIVNDRLIGRGRGLYCFPLQKGENSIVLGLPEKNYRLRIMCE